MCIVDRRVRFYSYARLITGRASVAIIAAHRRALGKRNYVAHPFTGTPFENAKRDA